MAQPVEERIRNEVIYRNNNFADESVAQTELAFLVPCCLIGDVRHRLRTYIHAVSHRFKQPSSRALASSQGIDVLGLTSRSRNLCSIITFSASDSSPSLTQSSRSSSARRNRSSCRSSGFNFGNSAMISALLTIKKLVRRGPLSNANLQISIAMSPSLRCRRSFVPL